MEKKLKISLDLDDKQFNASIKRMTDQLAAAWSSPALLQQQRQISQKMQSLGLGGLSGAPSMAQTEQAQNKAKQQSDRVFEDTRRKFDIIKRLQGDLNKEQSAGLATEQRKLEIREKLLNLTEKEKRATGELRAQVDRQDAQQQAKRLEMSKIIGGTGSAIGAAAMVAEYMARRPVDIARMQGTAVAGTAGRQLAEARTGEYTYQGMFGEDRKRASETAAKARTTGEIADWGKLIAGAAIAGGALLAIPTGGLSMGAGLGVAAAAGGVAYSSLSKGILDPQKYAAYQAAQYSQDLNTVLESSHETQPLRKAAIDRLRDTANRDIGTQRSLGLGDTGYYGAGGYLQGQMGLGFTDQMITGASQGILAAGGSTAMARQSGTALQAERGLDLTNSPQLLGMLSGTQSIPETSKKSLIDIFARGFDSSKYAEENRKYMQSVSEQVFKGGTTSVDAVDRIAELMRSTISGAPTTRGIEAGKTAFEAFQTAGTATSGYLGGINVASAMQDPSLSKISDPAEFQALLKLKPNEIDETDPDFIESARKIGLTGPELARKLTNRPASNVKKGLAGRSGTGFAARGMVEQLIPGLGNVEQKAFLNLVNQPASPERDAQIKKMMTEAEGKMGAKDTGRAGDTLIQASTVNAGNSLKTLSESINQFAKDAMEAAKTLRGNMPGLKSSEAGVAAAQSEYDAAKKHPAPVWNPKTHTMDFPMDTAGRKLSNAQNQANSAAESAGVK